MIKEFKKKLKYRKGKKVVLELFWKHKTITPQGA